MPSAGGCLWTYSTANGRPCRRALWRDTELVGNPTLTLFAGTSWLMGVSGWALEMKNGLAGRRLWLGQPAAGTLAFDPLQNSLIGVTCSGCVLSYDDATLRPNPHWTAWMTLAGADTHAVTEREAEAPDADAAVLNALPTAPGGVALGETVESSPVPDSVNGLVYIATDSHRVYAVGSADGTLPGNGWPFAPSGAAGAAFRATPLLWPSRAAAAPTLYVGDTAGGLYAVPSDCPAQAVPFVPPAGPLPPLGEWEAAPAASGTGPQDVLVVGNTNGVVYGLALR